MIRTEKKKPDADQKELGSRAKSFDDIKSKIMELSPLTPRMEASIATVIQKHKERLAYNAAYQRDLRTIKRLGLNCTVKEWREKNEQQ